MIWLNILKNPKILLSIGLVVAVGLFLLWWRNEGYRACKQDALTQTIKVTEKRNDIANNRPDDADFLNGLLKHSDTWK